MGSSRHPICMQAVYVKITSGSCSDNGMVPIVTVSTCEAAANTLGLTDKIASQSFQQTERPEGCYWWSSKQELWVASSAENQGNGADSSRHPICMRATTGMMTAAAAAPDTAEASVTTTLSTVPDFWVVSSAPIKMQLFTQMLLLCLAFAVAAHAMSR